MIMWYSTNGWSNVNFPITFMIKERWQDEKKNNKTKFWKYEGGSIHYCILIFEAEDGLSGLLMKIWCTTEEYEYLYNDINSGGNMRNMGRSNEWGKYLLICDLQRTKLLVWQLTVVRKRRAADETEKASSATRLTYSSSSMNNKLFFWHTTVCHDSPFKF